MSEINVGHVLKQRREELGLTLTETANKTKISIGLLKSIEEGDLSYFRDDLSYYRFQARYYAKSLGLNEDEILPIVENDIVEYTQSLSIKKIVPNAEKQVKHTKKRTDNVQYRTAKGKIDFSWVMMIIVILVVIGIIGYNVVNYFKDRTTVDPDLVGVSIDYKFPYKYFNDDELNIDPPKQEDKYEIKKISVEEYEVYGWKNPIKVELRFIGGSSSGLGVTLNDKVELPSQVYGGNPIVLNVNPVLGDTLTIRYGFIYLNEVYINDQKLEIDASVVGKQGTHTIILRFKENAQ